VAAFADAIFKGQIGKVVFLRVWGGCSRFWSPAMYPKGEADYLLVHNGMHWMDFITWLTGEYPSGVYTLGHPGEGDVPLWEYFVVNAEFPSGAMALYEDNRIIQPQTGYPTVGNGIYAIGENGTLSLESTGGLAVSLYNKDGLNFPGSHAYSARCEDNFAGEIRHFADCILNDSQPAISLEHSKKVLTAVLAASESFRTAKPVEVRYE
ncbi:MAG: Gfo/Idh/MocA family oxidoreductase, partial [Candidatus Pacebacteria bacterium]|nr:Gfo/Idh/MocA family oxidoreductase [Candidatus Paceibacterota bacterium]